MYLDRRVIIKEYTKTMVEYKGKNDKREHVHFSSLRFFCCCLLLPTLLLLLPLLEGELEVVVVS